MKLASVVLDIPSQSLDREYFYSIPETLIDECRVGCAVLVSFGSRQAVGFVMDIFEYMDDDVLNKVEEPSLKYSTVQLGLFGENQIIASSVAGSDPNQGASQRRQVSKKTQSKKPRSYKPIQRVLTSSLFTDLGAKCARYLASRYVAPLSSCVRLLTPPGGVPAVERVGGEWMVTQPKIQEVDDRFVYLTDEADVFVPRKNAVKQRLILAALKQGELRVAELTAEYGSVSSVLRSLEEKGVVVIESRRRYRGDSSGESKVFTPSSVKPTLTSEQALALKKMEELAELKNGQVAVLDGVTGSGKTEVYLSLIEKTLVQGKSAIVLVPEISLTPQTVARFRGRFGDTVAVLHSRMGTGERFDQWDLIRSGKARVVVGARSALFAPVSQVGVIIIDEEHEGSYKQDSAPRYVSRDVAHWLAIQHNALLVLGSATPSIEALHECQNNDAWTKIDMPTRVNGKPLPTIEVVDMSKEFGGGNKHMFSRKLQKELLEVLERKEKAVLLLNQRGFAQFVLCRDCGFVPECPSCTTSLTYHEVGQKLTCHHCGFTMRVPNRCPECGSPYLKRFGAGTQRVEAELRSLLQNIDCTIIRMDSDTTSKKGAHQQLLEQFASAEAAVLLGTQMIAKGLDFDDVTLVGVINADTMLKLPDFRAPERTFDLIEQVAGRSGRAELDGKVIVQTYNASHYAIQAAAHYRRDYFLANDLKLRKELGYPPYSRLSNVLIRGRDEKRVMAIGMQVFEDLYKLLETEFQGAIQVFPPTPCVLSKVKNIYRYHLLVKIPEGLEVEEIFNTYFRKRKVENDVQVVFDVDPISIL